MPASRSAYGAPEPSAIAVIAAAFDRHANASSPYMEHRCYTSLSRESVEQTVPKLKTRKSAAKRFKITGTGKVMRPKGWGNKKRLAKSSRTKRSYADFFEVPASVAKAVKTMLPYGLS